MGNKSFTRFTVEGSKHYDSAAEAVAEARTMLYVSPEAAERAIERLSRGEAVTFTYGFKSVLVTPPGERR